MKGHIHTSRRPGKAGEPKCPDGNTGVASMCNFADGSKASTRSAEALVLTIRKQVVSGLQVSTCIVQLVESLIWPFVARFSLREPWFSDEQFRHLVSSLRVTAQRLSRVESEDNREQTYIKFWLDSYLCRVFKDEQRPAREPWITDQLFSGYALRLVVRAIAKRDVSFIYSLQKGSKKAWPKLGEVKEAAALRKHRERLSEDRGPIPPDLTDEIEFQSRLVFREVNQRSRQFTKLMPSGSACLQASRREGGALSLFKPYQLSLKSPDASKIGKLPVLNATLNAWRQETFNEALRVGVERATSMDPDGFLPALDVDVVAIPEPGKFRIITKGDGYLYTALQPLQGAMLSAWKRSPHSTMLDDDLTLRVRELDRNTPSLPFWCSGDFEASTDLLKRDATKTVLNCLSDAPLIKLAEIGLGPGRAKYPDGTVVTAREGQLMGHPLSFPILCVINLAVYLVAIERWVREKPGHPFDPTSRRYIGGVMRDNVLVNGDDILFKCTKSFYPVWIQTASDCGFKISQGKNYLSPDCAMINSQTYRRSNGRMERFGYLNLKLIKGTSLKGGDSDATPTQIGKDINRMVRLCPWTASAIPAAFSRWKSDWFGPIFRPNWYLPVHLGGFGLDRMLAPPTLRITKSQREMAARFVADPKLALYRRKGMDIPTTELAGAIANWKMITDTLFNRTFVISSDDLNRSDEWLARLAYAARAHHGSKQTSDKVFVAKFKPQYRLKPMSIDRINEYWQVMVYAANPPPCPPIGYIRLNSYNLDV